MTGSSKPDLFLVPANELYWSQYHQLCFEQYNYEPVRLDKTVLVAFDAEVLAAGCVLIHTDGPYVIANGVVINRGLSAEEQYNAAVFLQNELKKLSTMLNRNVMVFSNHAGLIRVVEKHGYTRLPAELWFYSPSNTYIHPSYSKTVVSITEPERLDFESSTATAEPGKVSDADLEELLDEVAPIKQKKRGPGRPKGSKNKRKTTVNE